MSQAFLIFDFGTNEEAAQLARHRLEGWRQGFRLGDKLELRFERTAAESNDEGSALEKDAVREPTAGKQAAEKPAHGGKAGHAKKGAQAKKDEEKQAGVGKPDAAATAADEEPSSVRLFVRLGFSNHEKLSYQRWLERIPSEEPFKTFSPTVIPAGSEAFAAMEDQFESLKQAEGGKQRSR